MDASPKTLTAKIIEWDKGKGYGFLESGGDRIFLHRRDFAVWNRTPVIGETIRFSRGRDASGRPCAVNAMQSTTNTGGRNIAGTLLKLVLLLIVPGVAGWVYGFGHPGWMGNFLFVNVLTAYLYFLDKRRARAGAWRIPEVNLHLLEALGGWPAAFLAQRFLRHKSSKSSYQTVFWLMVLAYQLAAWDSLHRWQYSRSAWHWLESRVAGI